MSIVRLIVLMLLCGVFEFSFSPQLLRVAPILVSLFRERCVCPEKAFSSQPRLQSRIKVKIGVLAKASNEQHTETRLSAPALPVPGINRQECIWKECP